MINIGNFVKGSALNTRLFRNLCKEMDAIHDSLLYYTQFRWLSRGDMMIRFHDLLGEIQSFLENQRKDVLLAKTKDDFFGLSLAYLSDIFELLNELNRKMQGSDNNVITHTDAVKTFIAKLELWHGRVQENITMQFLRYSEVIVTVSNETICCRIQSYISEHLENLIGEFRRYFPNIVNDDTLLVRNPFRCEVKDVQIDMQE